MVTVTFLNIYFLTKELHTNKVIPIQFSLFSTAANESRKIFVPVEPVNHSAAEVADGRISFVVNVIRKNTNRLGITERKKKHSIRSTHVIEETSSELGTYGGLLRKLVFFWTTCLVSVKEGRKRKFVVLKFIFH